jgi:LmbE family N-acetylglucosaminyl deacetylase
MLKSLVFGRVLFIGAHCDDIEIGCGGTAATFARKKKPVAFAIATPEDSQLIDNGASFMFSTNDFKDKELPSLRTKLTNTSLSEWLLGKFSNALRKQLVNAKADISSLKANLANELNAILSSEQIYTNERFAGTQLRAETQSLMSKPVGHSALLRLNRFLLGDAYIELMRYPERRRIEATKSAQVLGLSEADGTLFFGSFPDGELDLRYKELRDWFKYLDTHFKPDSVFLHRNDDHTDHQAIHKVGIGVFQTKNVFFYYIPRPSPETPFDSNYAEIVSGSIQDKVKMCACHESQPDDYVHEDTILTNAHYWYLRWYARLKPDKNGYAEPFIIRGWRPGYYGEPSRYSDSAETSIKYGLRVVREPDGTFTWEGG